MLLKDLKAASSIAGPKMRVAPRYRQWQNASFAEPDWIFRSSAMERFA
jgi:hypothetical protein